MEGGTEAKLLPLTPKASSYLQPLQRHAQGSEASRRSKLVGILMSWEVVWVGDF